MKGAEADRLSAISDPRIKQRIAFYVNTGQGIFPESGVGNEAHVVTLNNLYDADADALKLFRNSRGDANAAEVAVVEAGYDGYLSRESFGNQGTVVLLGQRNLPVEHVGDKAEAIAKSVVPPAPQMPAAKLGARALLQDRTLPAGQMTKAEWAKLLKERGYDIDISSLKDGQSYYRSDVAGVLWQPADETRKGSFNPNTLTIRYLAEADPSTVVHELGHYMLTVYADIASQPDAPQSIKDDVDAILKHLGVADLATWNGMDLLQQTRAHEAWAESLEAYVMEGKAPSKQLQPVFKQFADWMKKVYISILNFLRNRPDVKLNPELEAVMGRMLATEAQIEAMNNARGYVQKFKDAVDMGVSPAAFAEYAALTDEQKEDAESMLRSRSLRDLRWTQHAREKYIKDAERDLKEKRKDTEAEVKAELDATPLRRAIRWLKYGEITQEDGTETKVLAGNKLAIADVKALFPAEALEAQPDYKKLGYGQYGMLAEEGMSPDQAAEIFGYRSGDQLVRELLEAPNYKEELARLTDERMIEKYGALNSREAVERAADEAIHNAARLRAVATELTALNKNVGSVAQIMKAAREYAAALVDGRTYKTLGARKFAAAEVRAGRNALALLKKGKRDEAAGQLRTEVLNHAAARAAYDAQRELDKIVAGWKRIAGYKDDSSAIKTRDAAIVSAVRAILADVGVGNKGKAAKEYIELVKQYDPGLGEVLGEIVDSLDAGKDWRDMKVQQVRDLNDAVGSLWHLAKRSRQVEIDGQLVPRAQIEQEIYDRLDEIGIPDTLPGEGSAVTVAEKRGMRWDSWLASLRRVESWVGGMDAAEMGPFRKYIWSQIRDAGDRYRVAKADVLKRYQALIETVAPTFKRQTIDAPELGYVFGKGEGGMGKVELLHALLHTGNKSNLKKLLLGRNWATERADGSLDTAKWDAFVKRMKDQGILTKADYDFAQGVWDLLEETKPAAQKAHRAVFGRYFDEVTADGFSNEFGSYRGGYVPATVDSAAVQDAQLRELANTENENLSYAFPATAKGFTKKRVEYNRPLLLDLRTLSGHIDKVLLFSHLTEPVNDVRRIVMSKRVSGALGRVQPQAIGSLITPWLNRAAKQQVETKIPGRELLGGFWREARSRAGMAAMFANVANSVQQVTGLSLAAVKVRPKHLAQALVNFSTSPKEMSAFVSEHSDYMKTRLDAEIANASNNIEEILINPTVYESGKNWSKKHAYFMQSAVDSIVGPVVWLGAYNQALETMPPDMTPEEQETYARRLADSAVRETQGSSIPEDIAAFETGSAFYRMFTQFAGYFNMNANLLGTEYRKLTRGVGLKNGAGRGLYVLTMGLLAPALVGELIMQLFKGGPDDEDGDGVLWDDWIAAIFGYGLARYMTAMIPVGGTVINAVVNSANNKPYDDRISTSPAISMAESAAKAPVSVYKAIVEDGKPSRAVKDVATLLSLSLGVPASAVAKPISYAADVATGNVKPTSAADMARGIITGAARPESKQR